MQPSAHAQENSHKDEYVRRLLKIRTALNGLAYRTIYEYEFCEKLNKEGVIAITNFWNYNNNDERFLCRFEWIVENMNRIPEIAK